MRKLKFSISNIAWDKNDDNEMYSFLKDNGFTGLEIAPSRIFENAPYECLKEAKIFKEKLNKDYNLEICSMQSIWFGKTENIFNSATEKNSLIDYTKKAVDFAVAIGCSNLVFGCPKNRNMKICNHYNRNIAIDFFKEIGEYALKNNVIIAIEPNPVIYNTNFLNTTKDAIDIVREINIPSLKINCDIGTVIYNDENIDLILNNLDVINHIHISEPNLAVLEKRNLHNKLFDGLEKFCYSKYVSIEMKKSDLDVVKSIIKYVKEI